MTTMAKNLGINSVLAKIRKLYDWTLEWADHHHNTKFLSGISFIEASFFPIPPDPLLLAMGVARPKKSLYYALLTTVFSVLGGLFGYFIGYVAWQYMAPFFFHYVFSQETFDMVVSQFQDHAFVAIFIAGFSPIPFKVFTIAAGVAQVALFPFTLAAVLSRGLRFFILGALVYFWGNQIRTWIETHFEKVTYGFSAFLIIAIVIIKFLI